MNQSKSIPSTLELIKFGLPTLGIWLLQPILSLIDTSVVGLSPASTLSELAALGPGIAWIDSSSYMFQFLGMATTNLYANSLRDKDLMKSYQVLSQSLFISVVFGILLGLFQFGLSWKVIPILSGSSIESVPYGILYAQIRSIAAPFAIPTIVGQAAFLASKDAVTPLKAVLIGALVNLLGDLYLVTYLKTGILGAALATAISQIAGALYLLQTAIHNISKQIKTENNINNNNNNYNNNNINNNYNNNNNINSTFDLIINRLKIPSLDEIKAYLLFCRPLFSVLLIKTFQWTYTTFAASTAGTVDLAAHQILINFFLFFAIIGDTLSQISQTFVPYFLTNPTSKTIISSNLSNKIINNKSNLIPQNNNNNNNNNKGLFSNSDASKLIRKIIIMGGSLGIMNAFATLIIKRFFLTAFTKSQEVTFLVGKIMILLGCAILPHSTMSSLEGVLIASRDTLFHSSSYYVFGTLFILSQTYVRSKKLGVVGVWSVMAFYQWIRPIIFARRVNSLKL
eukprot:gene4380-6195_t